MEETTCPLKQGSITTPPSVVQGIREISFEVDPQGGSGTRYMHCDVCGKEFSVSEDVGYHFPQYHWPGKCMREESSITNPAT